MGNNVVEAGLIDRVIKFWCGGYVEIFFSGCYNAAVRRIWRTTVHYCRSTGRTGHGR